MWQQTTSDKNVMKKIPLSLKFFSHMSDNGISNLNIRMNRHLSHNGVRNLEEKQRNLELELSVVSVVH